MTPTEKQAVERVPNLVKCYRCTALYAKGGWSSGYRDFNGTMPASFRKVTSIPDEHCPICRKPHLTEQPPIYPQCM